MGRSRTRLAIVAASVLLATGCSSVAGTPTTPSAQDTRFATALHRIDSAAIGDTFEFGDTKAIAALAAQDAYWKRQIGIGAGGASLESQPVKEALGIDIAGSDLMISVGSPPEALTLVIGGQDGTAITTAAGKSGWTGSGTLTRALGGTNTPTDVALFATRVRPLGADVAFGEQQSDLTLIDDGAAASGQPGLAALSGCLGQVVAARAAPVRRPPADRPGSSSPSRSSAAGASGALGSGATVSEAAIGVRAVPGSTRTTSVICMVTASGGAGELTDATKAALASGSSFQTRQKWSTFLPSAQVDSVPGPNPIVRITADTDSRQSAQVLLLLTTGDLPGAN